MVVAGERERERSRRKEKQTDLLVMGGEGGFLISFLSQFSQLRLLFFFLREKERKKEICGSSFSSFLSWLLLLPFCTVHTKLLPLFHYILPQQLAAKKKKN